MNFNLFFEILVCYAHLYRTIVTIVFITLSLYPSQYFISVFI